MTLGEDYEPCLTLDQFASMNISKTATLVLIPGHHRLSRNIVHVLLNFCNTSNKITTHKKELLLKSTGVSTPQDDMAAELPH